MSKYQDLKAWQESRKLCKMICLSLKQLPPEELYALSSQMRRAVVSIASNIAEGAGRGNNKELLYFLRIARGSSYELETQIIICADLAYLDKETSTALYKQNTLVQKLLNGFMRSLQDKPDYIREDYVEYGTEGSKLDTADCQLPTANYSEGV